MTRLVIADDHRVVREGLRWMLASEPGIEVVAEAESGTDLLHVLDEVDDVDLVLLDLRMPGMSGFDVLERLATVAPGVAALVLSMHDDSAYVKRAITLGAAGYLLKSVGHAELVRAIEVVTRGETYVQAELSGPLLMEASGKPAGRLALSAREREILQMVADGAANKQIAATLDLSEATIKWSLKNIFAKLGVGSRAEAVATALRTDLIT
ncbi:MAG: response regulator transcription factor [Actinomycetia bacterium]|nr:response regulator transcription factor [Actinomycetes bacterium]